MNPEQPEPSPSKASALQALSLSDIEEGMGHNVERTQELQQELARRRASLEQELAKAQALQGKEALLANIIEEEMAHWTELSRYQSYLSCLYAGLRKLSLNWMRYDVSQLCWKNSKLSWRESRSSRVRYKKCQFLDTLHHNLRNYTERH